MKKSEKDMVKKNVYVYLCASRGSMGPGREKIIEVRKPLLIALNERCGRFPKGPSNRGFLLF